VQSLQVDRPVHEAKCLGGDRIEAKEVDTGLIAVCRHRGALQDPARGVLVARQPIRAPGQPRVWLFDPDAVSSYHRRQQLS
jgi:hypothetical protein